LSSKKRNSVEITLKGEVTSSNRRWVRAQRLVETLSVKLHIFLPSGRTIWTVVGREGDFLVDCSQDPTTNPYCSCNDFHFRVLGGKVGECYHLTALKTAMAEGQYAQVEFNDEEYEAFLKALLHDVFSNL
jgi:predicted nucleic acid-binding Zn finger protein